MTFIRDDPGCSVRMSLRQNLQVRLDVPVSPFYLGINQREPRECGFIFVLVSLKPISFSLYLFPNLIQLMAFPDTLPGLPESSAPLLFSCFQVHSSGFLSQALFSLWGKTKISSQKKLGSFWSLSPETLKPYSSLALLSPLTPQIHSVAKSQCSCFSLNSQILPGCFLRARYYSRCFKCTISFDLLSSPMRMNSFPIVQMEESGVERADNLPKVRKLGSRGAGAQTQVFQTQYLISPTSFPEWIPTPQPST